jgi:hypothetical protein
MKVTTALRGEPGGPFPAIVSSTFRETPRPSKAAGGGTEGSNPSSSSGESGSKWPTTPHPTLRRPRGRVGEGVRPPISTAADSMSLPKLNPVEPPWYGPVCPVVGEGWHREVSPYPDLCPHLPFAIPVGIGSVGWKGGIPDLPGL